MKSKGAIFRLTFSWLQPLFGHFPGETDQMLAQIAEAHFLFSESRVHLFLILFLIFVSLHPLPKGSTTRVINLHFRKQIRCKDVNLNSLKNVNISNLSVMVRRLIRMVQGGYVCTCKRNIFRELSINWLMDSDPGMYLRTHAISYVGSPPVSTPSLFLAGFSLGDSLSPSLPSTGSLNITN